MAAVLGDWRSIGVIVSGIVALVFLFTILVLFRKTLEELITRLKNVKGGPAEVTFQDSLDQARRGAAGVGGHVPTGKGKYAEVYGHFAERLDQARSKAEGAPVPAMEEAGGALREFLEAATKVAGIDMSLSSSRLVALAKTGMPFSILEAALQLTLLEVLAIRPAGPAITTANALDYIDVTRAVAGQVLAYLKRG